MHAAMIAYIFEHAVNGTDDAALAANIVRRARIAGGIFDGDDDGVAHFVFATRLVHDFSIRSQARHFRFEMSRLTLTQLRRFQRVSYADQAVHSNERR